MYVCIFIVVVIRQPKGDNFSCILRKKGFKLV